MHIVCPHCATSFAIDRRTLGADGRTVRCARCRGTWFALPADEPEALAVAAGPAAGAFPNRRPPAAPAPDRIAETAAIPTVASPPLAGEPAEDPPPTLDVTARPVSMDGNAPARARIVRRIRKTARRPATGWPAACLAAGMTLLALLIWRAEVVRILPQTAPLFRAIGLEVNLRGLTFRDVTTRRDTVGGQPVLVVEGEIDSVAGATVDVPRLRLSVLDAQNVEIYSWTADPGQSKLAPGGSMRFRARLAEPPADGRRIEVRFLGRHDAGT